MKFIHFALSNNGFQIFETLNMAQQMNYIMQTFKMKNHNESFGKSVGVTSRMNERK